MVQGQATCLRRSGSRLREARASAGVGRFAQAGQIPCLPASRALNNTLLVADYKFYIEKYEI
jgi:hypothetical protein